MAILGRWTGGTIGTMQPGTTWAAPNGLFPTQARNDSSTYSWASSTSTLTLPSSGLADGYLLIAFFEFEDSSNGRHNPQGRIIQASGTGTFVGAQTGGFNRDNSEDRAWVRSWAFVDSPSASSTYQFQWKRDSDAPGTSDGTVNSTLEVIPLYYADWAAYTSSSTATYGGTTPTKVTGFTGTDGSNITISSDTVTIASSSGKRYLCLGSYFMEDHSGGDRTQRWAGFRQGGTKLDYAKGHGYWRNASNDELGIMFSHLLETGGTTETVDVFSYRGDGVSVLQGGADVDGSGTETNGHHCMVLLELNSAAEVFRSRETTGGTDIANGGTTDVNIVRTLDINDSDAFTKASDTAINAEKAMDTLLGGHINSASNSTSDGSRFSCAAFFTNNGTEDQATEHGNYSRQNQTSQDTWGQSATLLSFMAVANGDDIGASTVVLSGTEAANDDFQINASWAGMWGVNLDSLEAAGGDAITEVSSGSLSMSGQQPTVKAGVKRAVVAGLITMAGTVPTVVAGADTTLGTETLTLTGQQPTVVATGGGNAITEVSSGSLTLTGQQPTLELGATITPSSGSLSLTGQQPTVSVGTSVAVSPISGALTLTGQTPSLRADARAAVVAGSLTLTGQQPTLEVGTSITPSSGSLTLTGQQPTLEADAKPAVLSGLLTLTGQQPTVISGGAAITLVSSGSLTLTGQQPTLELGASVTPSSGSLALTGQQPTVSVGTGASITPVSGLITLTGQQPTIVAGTGIAVTPSSGLLTLTGQQPTLEAWAVSVPSSGSLTLAGQQPTIVAGTGIAVTPSSGLLTLTGQTPTLKLGAKPTVSSGLLTLAGQQPAVITGGSKIVIPVSGSLTLTGQQPTLKLSWRVPMVSGSLTLAGQQPTASGGAVSVPASGLITLTGQQPTVISGGAAITLVSSGLITLTGQQPTIEAGALVVAASGSLSLSGNSPTMVAGALVEAVSGSLTLTGQQPTVLAGAPAIILVSSGSLTLTGQQPTLETWAVPLPASGLITLTGQQPTLETWAVPLPASGLITLTGQQPIVAAAGLPPDVIRHVLHLARLLEADGNIDQAEALTLWVDQAIADSGFVSRLSRFTMNVDKLRVGEVER